MVDSGDGQFVLLFSEEELLVTQSSLQRLGLTARESEVMFWLAEGKANAEIGAILESSPRTIERHVANILKKFQVENRVAAVRHVAERLQPRGISN
jgi:DNA-binding CsgD family transcriptional regulator